MTSEPDSREVGSAARYLVFFGRRLLGHVGLLLAIIAVVFILTRVAGGDPARRQLGLRASQEAVNALRHELGVDRPLVVQFVEYVVGLPQGDLGNSYASRQPVAGIIRGRIVVTCWLLAGGLLVSILISLPCATLSARRPNGIVDRMVRLFSIGAVVMPQFWLGVLLILVFSLRLGWFPIGGFGPELLDRVRSIALPATTIGIALAPAQIRTLRSSLIAALDGEYIDAARARGVPERRLLARHALPNAILPTATVVAVQAGFLLFAAVVVENTFRLPGLGQGMVHAVDQRDYPVILAITVLFSAFIVIFNLLAELFRIRFDPKGRAR